MLKTKDGRLLAVEKLTWADVVDAIDLTNPALAKTMRLLHSLDYVFYRASYRFGDKIISNGKCYLPLQNGGSIAFNDLDIPDTLRNDLNYDKKEDPLGLVLSKNSEFYLLGNDGVHTQSVVCPGQMFGIPKAIDANANDASTSALELNLNAGSRSLFMLSRIADQAYHSKIQKHYGIELSVPSTSQEHWAIFVDIANKANSPWRCEVIYFSRKWINQVKNDDWAPIARRLSEINRASYSIWHKVADLWNQTFHEIERDRKLDRYYSLQSIDAGKQLFKLAGHINYGFKPTTNDDSAPISLIIDAYTNIYDKLAKQNYLPIIMEAAKFDINRKYPIYYSINHSAVNQDELEFSKNKSQIARIDEIRRVVENYTKIILEEKNHVKSLYDVTKATAFSYYHINPEDYDKINNAALIGNDDIRFANGKSATFPANSLFFRGCVKISRQTP